MPVAPLRVIGLDWSRCHPLCLQPRAFQVSTGPRLPGQLRAAAALHGSGAARGGPLLPPRGKSKQQPGLQRGRDWQDRWPHWQPSPPRARPCTQDSLAFTFSLTPPTALFREQVTPPLRGGGLPKATTETVNGRMEMRTQGRV